MTAKIDFTAQNYIFFWIYAKKVVPLQRFMEKKRLFYIIEWVVALVACAYLVYRLVTFEEYASLWHSLSDMCWQHWLALLGSLALMPVNMSLEAWRWKTLIPMSWREAHQQVYYSKLAGLITPWRLGEYPARALLMSESAITNEQSPITNHGLWPRVLSMGAVGSATMTIAIIIAGVAGLAFSPSVLAYLGNSYLYALLAITIVLGALFAFAPRILKRFAQVNHDLMLRSIGQSLVRLACWCVQLYFVLWALDGIGSLGVLGNLGQLPIYYLLVTVTPSVPVVEVGVRGAWAMWLFGSVNAALAGVLLWGINTLLPCLIWPFLKKK